MTAAVLPEFDEATQTISMYAAGSGRRREDETHGGLADSARNALISHFIDALGCGIAALRSEAGRTVRASASGISSERGASILGGGHSAPEVAAFVNTSLVRILDFNDVYNSRSGGHPSNLFPGILGVAEAHRLTGADVMRGIHVATEVYGALCDAVSLRERGWDAGPFLSISCAAGVGALLGFDADRIGHAVSLCATSAIHLGVIRAGTLSDWKGCAEGQAVMSGLWFTRLAGCGMTGPARPFSGVTGFLEQVAGPLELAALGAPVLGRTVLERTAYKFRPVQWTAQAPIEKFVSLAKQLDVEQIDAVTISGSEFMCKAVGGGRGDAADKWDPQTRETADHSLPFLAAVALVDGEVTLDSYRTERILDPSLRPLMRRIQVVEDPAVGELGGGRQPFQITVSLSDGRRLRERGEFPHGDWTRPASDDEIDHKFRLLADDVIGAERAEQMLQCARGLERLGDLGALTRLLRDAE